MFWIQRVQHFSKTQALLAQKVIHHMHRVYILAGGQQITATKMTVGFPIPSPLM
jgi:hypothetical protein